MGSSPFPDDLKTARLHVRAGSPLAEVFLIDHEFALKERSIGDLDVEVEPGVYNVKARLGDATVEQLVVLNEDQEVDLSDELSPASPAPGSAVQVAIEESAKVADPSGSGAEVLLLAQGERELSLHRPDGEQVQDPARVDPGTYFVRWKDDTSGLGAEQALEAVDGWRTQVHLGPHRVSVLMSRRGVDPDEEMLRRTEEAGAALAAERKVASDTISESLFAKADNPILGLFGAHLMLLAQGVVEQAADEESARDPDRVLAPVGFDQSLFDTAVGNLRGLLGAGNPDVVALSTRATRPPDPLPPVSAPPMLWRSWLLLTEASNDSPDLLPLAVCRQVGRRLPVRPFLVWSPVDEQEADEWQTELERAVKGSAAVADEETRRKLSEQLLVPRAAIDEVVGPAS